jgi:hypothetical protein
MFHALKAIPMNKEENAERQEREGRYRESQDDISIIRREVNKLTGVVGELMVAIKGNDMGTEGMAKQIREIKEIADTLSDRVKDLEDKERFREKAWRVVFLLVGTVAGTYIKTIIDRLIPLKK